MLFAGRYELLTELGAGGMGKVFRARDHRVMGREVALKVMRSDMADSPTASERFMREVAVSSRLEHTHTVRVYDFGKTEEGELYLAMQLIDGCTLADLIRVDQQLDIKRLVHISEQVARGLMAAHAQGITHRDLKPGNIMIGPQPDNPDHTTLVDFGIATVDGTDRLTRSGMITGSAPYCSPEQVRGELPGPAGDLYSLGVVMYEALTGIPCWDFEDRLAYLVAHLQEVPRPPSELNSYIPAWLDRLILSLLEKDPNRRPASASAVLDELRGRQQSAPMVTPSGADTLPAPRPVSTGASPTTGIGVLSPRRSRMWVGVAGVGAALLIVGIVALATGGNVEPPPPDPGAQASLIVLESQDTSESDTTEADVAMAISDTTADLPADTEAPVDTIAEHDTSTPVIVREPTPPTPRRKRIVITSEPKGAEVYDAAGKLLGVTNYAFYAKDGESVGPFELRAPHCWTGRIEQQRCCSQSRYHLVLREIK